MAPRTKSREAVTLELAEEVLRSSGRLQFVAHGSSMIPAILPGDVLLARHQPIQSIQRGAIALWSRDGRFCAHRIRYVQNAGDRTEIITRGDALQQDDQSIRADEFLGCVYAVGRHGKQIDVSRPPSVWSRSIAFLLRHSEVAAEWFLRYHSFAARINVGSRASAKQSRSELVECQ